MSSVVPPSAPVNLLNLDRAGLENFFRDLGEKPFRASQVMKWVHQQGVNDFAEMTNLGKALRARLQATASLSMPEVVTEHRSTDGTRKWVLRLDETNHVETVFIPDEERYTLCVSSQVGCALNCSFCATARQGFNRNLNTAEILAQLWFAEHQLRREGWGNDIDGRVITNVVFMGMGEPLLNFANVTRAIRVMLDDFAYGLAWRRVTVSTAGVVPAIDRLKAEAPVSLALSLHATEDTLRDQLVPLNKKYPLTEVLAACRRYLKDENRRRLTVEYVMLKEINDHPRHARQLAGLLRGIPAKINLIPFNPFPGTPHQGSTEAARETFRDILMRAGFIVITRKTRGDDISAACGQLAGKVKDKTKRRLNPKEISA